MTIYDKLKEAVAELKNTILEAETAGFDHEDYAKVLEAGRIKAIDIAEALYNIGLKREDYIEHLKTAKEWEGYLADLEGTDAEKANAAHEQARWAVREA